MSGHQVERTFNPDTVARWRWCFEQCQTRSQKDVAAELGVSKQAVYLMCKSYREYLDLLETQQELQQMRNG